MKAQWHSVPIRHTPLKNGDLTITLFLIKESLIIVFILLYGLKVQSQRNNRQRNLRMMQRFDGRIIQLLNVLMNWCAYFQDYDETSTEKKILNARVAPYENEVLVKVEKKKTEKHPWDIANEIIKE